MLFPKSIFNHFNSKSFATRLLTARCCCLVRFYASPTHATRPQFWRYPGPKGYWFELELYNVFRMKRPLTVKDWTILQEMHHCNGFPYKAIMFLRYVPCDLNDLKICFEALEKTRTLPALIKCYAFPLYYKLRSQCSEDDHKQILSILNEASNYPVLTVELTICLLQGVMVTPSWKELGLSLLERLKRLKPQQQDISRFYDVYIAAAFHHHDPDYGWKLIEEVVSDGGIIASEVYHSIMDYHESKSIPPKLDDIMKIIKLFEQTTLMPNKKFALRLCDYFEYHTTNWIARTSSVNLSGICSCCHLKLVKIFPSKQEMEKVAENIFKNSVLNDNLLAHTSPKEISRFFKFLDNCDPYHVVLDGCNISLKRSSQLTPSEQLESAIESFLIKGLRVLVITRIHISRLIDVEAFPRNVQFFFVSNESIDDAFILYAAFKNGPGTLVVSNDYYGDFYATLDPSSKKIFRQWQLVSHVLRDSLHELVIPKYSPSCQISKNRKHIHVPFCEDRRDFSASGWLCLQNVGAEKKIKDSALFPKQTMSNERIRSSTTYRRFASETLEERYGEQHKDG